MRAIRRASPFDSGTYAGTDGSRQPSQIELDVAKHQATCVRIVQRSSIGVCVALNRLQLLHWCRWRSRQRPRLMFMSHQPMRSLLPVALPLFASSHDVARSLQ